MRPVVFASSRFVRGLSLVLVFVSGCKACVGARSDAELLPELDRALESFHQPDDWRSALRRFEWSARIYRRPTLANRIFRLATQAEAATQPESLCTPVQVAHWIRAHLSRLRAALDGQAVTRVEPVLCGSTPRPLVRDVDEAWVLYGLDLQTDRANLRLLLASTATTTDVTPYLSVLSPVKAVVRFSGAGALRLSPGDYELVLQAGSRVLSRLPIVETQPVLRITTTVERGAVSVRATATATVPTDHVLVGGGCRGNYTTVGQLLTASYPSKRVAWRCEARAHLEPEPSYITAYALSVPRSLGFVPRVVTSTSRRGLRLEAQALLPAGYSLLSGGCRVTEPDVRDGPLLVDMAPGTSSFHCRCRDHLVKSQATLRAYAVGIPDDAPFEVFMDQSPGVEARQGHVSARMTTPYAALVGGGCSVSQTYHGNLLWAAYPRVDERRWVCAHTDHQKVQRATPTAYALGLRLREAR